MIRLGLCCKFNQEPIKFRTVTATYLQQFSRSKQLKKISDVCLANAHSLLKAIEYCGQKNIGCFRINSQILPLKTHPQQGYAIEILPDYKEIREIFLECGKKAFQVNVRLTFHPDQFVLLSSPDKEIVRKSVQELEYQAQVSEWVGADVINIHGGGGYGDKSAALGRMAKVLPKLSQGIRKRLTLENDDRVYSPADLLPFCRQHHIPFVYDVHHHQCLSDKLTIPEVTKLALNTWTREPLFHLSSPRDGWGGSQPSPHHDYIDIHDFPNCWKSLTITIEVEAKAKELAVFKLQKQLQGKSRNQVAHKAQVASQAVPHLVTGPFSGKKGTL